MNILGRFTVLPNLPRKLRRLDELAYNLYWTWEPSARALFRRLDYDLWEASGHNPVVILRDISQVRLDEAAKDPDYLKDYRTVLEHFDAYLSGDSWFDREIGKNHVYAYFCAEYGWHEAVALYSGGLGVLAGDHTKAASDLGVPLVAVGLWYPEGYFHQRVADDGQQEAFYEQKSPQDLPFLPVSDSEGEEIRVSVLVFGREVQLRAWKVTVGRVSVFLLDTDIPENHPDDRYLLIRLYGGDQRIRISQEIILGIGGVRFLRALGITPTSWHMNEGHSAFMALERCRELVAEGMAFDQAREVVAANTLFTVHTPVAAGNDAFSFDLINQCFSGYWGSLGLSQNEFHELGHADHGWGPVFSMPALALRFTSGRNGVAKLHGETSRRIWNDLWPEVPTDEVPIGHVTNGVHTPTWMAPEIQDLVASELPPDWQKRLDDSEMWQAIKNLDNAALWRVRSDLKRKSVEFLRRRVLYQLRRQEASPTAIHHIEELLDAEILTIGFARRFATYKRATLIFRDIERLAQLLNDPERPLQLLFAGKAHPADLPGQALIAQIHNLSKDPRFSGKILFVEDYNMAVGRALTRGVDVWLNNPRRPLEASGTSGQKAAMNGILNLSVLDGWWPEGYDGYNGWAIGDGGNYDDEERADAADADALYDLLEREVVPSYYERDAAGIPQRWMDRAKAAISSITPFFNAQRMVKDYVTSYYAPASERNAVMTANDFQAAIDLAAWRSHVSRAWPNILLTAEPVDEGIRRMGEEIELEALLNPRKLGDTPLRVEVVYSLEEDALKHNLYIAEMVEEESFPDGGRLYRARFQPMVSGRLAFGIRVFPIQENLANPFDAKLIRWA